MLFSELEELEDIMDTLVFEEEPTIFNEDNTLELIETALHLMEEYMDENPTAITEPDFHETLLEEIKEMFYIQMEEDILKSDYIENDMNDLLEDAFNIFITTFYTERSMEQNNTIIHSEQTDEKYKKNDMNEAKINILREIPQPVQRTPEWYQFRWNLITASNAWKAFESQSTINQLIYEKCQPLKNFNDIDNEEIKMVNTNTAMHWGQKYEPLSVLIYEQKYNTKVEDFGCIQHPVYKFIGASPDGIIVDKNSERYGRMLEIKNVVSREINGIPKKEYWVQMQLQMEVCDLDECDFLETKFTEYPDRVSYNFDTSNEVFTDSENVEWFNICLSKDGKMKGEIIYFHTKEGKPFYVYKPLDCVHPNDISNWQDYSVETYENAPYNYIYMKTIFWKLDVLSCVLVLRNREWFKNNVPQLEKVWKIIEEERVTGYEHRAPVKKQKKEPYKPFVNATESQGCLLPFKKVVPNSLDMSFFKVKKMEPDNLV
jgi:putative phage-type endonuclease